MTQWQFVAYTLLQALLLKDSLNSFQRNHLRNLVSFWGPKLHGNQNLYRYEDAIRILKILLSKVACDRRRGYWALRLSIDLEHMGRPNESLSAAEGGTIDPWVRAGSKFALQRRVLRLSKPPRRWKVPSYADYVKRNIRAVYITHSSH